MLQKKEKERAKPRDKTQLHDRSITLYDLCKLLFSWDDERRLSPSWRRLARYVILYADYCNITQTAAYPLFEILKTNLKFQKSIKKISVAVTSVSRQ
jgi:hypothetical protein